MRKACASCGAGQARLRWLGCPLALVADEGPQNIEATAGEGEDRLLVALTLGAFVVIEGLRRGTEASGDLGGEVEATQKPAVVAAWPAHVAADTT